MVLLKAVGLPLKEYPAVTPGADMVMIHFLELFTSNRKLLRRKIITPL